MAVLLMLGGCATLPPMTAAQRALVWHRHRMAVSSRSRWTLSGDFAVRIKHHGWTAGIRWQQVASHFQIDIYDPLGRTVALLEGGPHSVLLEDEEGKSYQAASAASLMMQQLGWSLPVEGLIYWVRGLPVPGESTASMHWDEAGRLSHLKQEGWDILYQDYNYDSEGALPTRMTMTRGDVRLRVVVNQWRESKP